MSAVMTPHRQRARRRWATERHAVRQVCRQVRTTPGIREAGRVRAVIEAGHPDRCIVWEPGASFCAVVTAGYCPCPTFARDGACAHQRTASALLALEIH